MKNMRFWSLALAISLVAGAGPAWAIPPFKKAFDVKYGSNESLKNASAELKCNVCHYGNSKKNMNDYGKSLKQLLKKDNFGAERLKAEPEKVKSELEAAFAKVEGEKSTAGETFGERLKAGKAPGTPVVDK